MDISKSSLYQMFCTTTQGGQVNQKRNYKDQYWAFTTPCSSIAACRKRENKQHDSTAQDEPWSGRSKQEGRLERARMRARDGTRESGMDSRAQGPPRSLRPGPSHRTLPKQKTGERKNCGPLLTNLRLCLMVSQDSHIEETPTDEASPEQSSSHCPRPSPDISRS